MEPGYGARVHLSAASIAPRPRATMGAMQRIEDAIAPAGPAEVDEFEDVLDDDELAPAEAPPTLPQVPSYIAIIRIVAVLGMGLCISFGLFLMLIGLKGVLIGLPLALLSIPCYLGMQLAERLVANREAGAVPAELEEP
jgi:hypothetical protein